MVTILVTGNCQSTALARILEQRLGQQTDQFHIAAWPELHLIREEDLPELFLQLAAADIVLAMPVGDNYRSMPLGTNQLRDRTKKSAHFIIYPNLYFKGYFPHYDYIRDASNDHVTQATHPILGASPFGDYHDCVAAEFFFSRSPSLDNAFNEYEDYLACRSAELDLIYKSISEESLNELESRETACSVSLSRYIKENFAHKRLFHSFNHPANALLVETAVSVLSLCGCNGQALHSQENECHTDLLLKPQLPILPQVALSIGISFLAGRDDLIREAYHDYFRFLSANTSFFASIYELNAGFKSILLQDTLPL